MRRRKVVPRATELAPPASTPVTRSRLWEMAAQVALIADNPGIWMLHCHNTYQQEAGMMTSLNYLT